MNDSQLDRDDQRRPRVRAGRIALRTLPPIVLIVAALVLWQIYTVAFNVPDYLLPGPVSIWRSAVDQHDLLIQNTWPTVEVAVAGFLIALILGLGLAIAIRYSRLLELALYPIVIASQAVPTVALASILVVLLGFTILPKLIVVCLICFFPITVNAVDGFKSVDPDLVNLMRTFGAGRWRLFRDVEWPSALPSIFSGAKVAVTFSVVGAIFGELVGSTEGLGYLLTQERAQFQTGVMFAAMGILTLLGITLFATVSLLEKLLLPWYHDERRRDALTGRGR